MSENDAPQRRITDRIAAFDWEDAPDLTALDEGELRDWLKVLGEEEREVSYHRRVLQGRIDLLRVELVRRGGASLSPEELARVLMGGEGRGGEGAT